MSRTLLLRFNLPDLSLKLLLKPACSWVWWRTSITLALWQAEAGGLQFKPGLCNLKEPALLGIRLSGAATCLSSTRYRV